MGGRRTGGPHKHPVGCTTAVPPLPRSQDDDNDDSEGGVQADRVLGHGGVLLAKRANKQVLGFHHAQQWELLWTKSVYAIRAARLLKPGQVVSALAGLNCLTMKKRMVHTLHMALGRTAFRILPLSFCIPEELPEWRAWLASPAAAADTGLWMLKTGQDAGKGLRLVRTQHALQVAASSPSCNSRHQCQIKVAQQYITAPLLVQGRKFHLRLWLLVTSHRPLKAYLHCKGLVLFSSECYQPHHPVEGPGFQPAGGHVTNLARNEDTWVWGLHQLQEQLGQHQWMELWQTMMHSSAQTVAAVLGPLHVAHKWLQPSIPSYGFQLLGLDFLIDQALQPWLLEVNSAPSIMAVHNHPGTAALIKDTKQDMLRDMLAMVQHRLARDDGVNSRSRCVSWQDEYAIEMAARGGFQPLMTLFPMNQRTIPWQEQDLKLQELLQQ